ncbi:hypothetical protein Voja6_00005 [Pseudomonas phage vB_PpuM-Voja-6]
MKHNPQVTRLSALAAAGINVKSGSPVDVVHQHTRTLGNNIDKLSTPRQWAIAHLMNEAADLLVVETGSLQDDYIDYFKGALEKFGVSSPAELTQEKASEFFNWISDNWKKGEGPKETSGAFNSDKSRRILRDQLTAVLSLPGSKRKSFVAQVLKTAKAEGTTIPEPQMYDDRGLTAWMNSKVTDLQLTQDVLTDMGVLKWAEESEASVETAAPTELRKALDKLLPVLKKAWPAGVDMDEMEGYIALSELDGDSPDEAGADAFSKLKGVSKWKKMKGSGHSYDRWSFTLAGVDAEVEFDEDGIGYVWLPASFYPEQASVETARTQMDILATRVSDAKYALSIAKTPEAKAKAKDRLTKAKAAQLAFRRKSKATAEVETASQFSFVKVTQNGNTYRLEASDTGNFKSVMIWKGGMWTKPGPDEAFKDKEPHRMLGALRTPNGAELATLNLPETPVASMEEMAELFGAMGIEESEIRRFYGGGPEWNDRSVYDGNIPSVSPANLGVNPTYAYTDMHPLRAYEAEDTIRINGLDATLQSIDNGQAVFTVDGVDTTTVPLDNIVVAEGEASVVATAMVSHRVLVTAGHEDLTQYKSLRHDFEAVTANHQELSQVKVGPALQTLAKAGNRRALVLAHAGVQRINEGHALLKASIGYGKEAATASVITELADLNNLCGKDQVSPQDVIDSAPVVTHLKQGEFKEDIPDTVDSSDFELNDPQAEQSSARKSRFPSRKR